MFGNKFCLKQQNEKDIRYFSIQERKIEKDTERGSLRIILGRFLQIRQMQTVSEIVHNNVKLWISFTGKDVQYDHKHISSKALHYTCYSCVQHVRIHPIDFHRITPFSSSKVVGEPHLTRDLQPHIYRCQSSDHKRLSILQL